MPRVLELAASKAADFPAFDYSGFAAAAAAARAFSRARCRLVAVNAPRKVGETGCRKESEAAVWSLEATLQARASLQVRRFKTPHCILLFFSAAGFATLRLLCSRFRHAATTAKNGNTFSDFRSACQPHRHDTNPPGAPRPPQGPSRHAPRLPTPSLPAPRLPAPCLPPPRLPARCLPRHHRLIARRIRTREACRPR